jgi:hypothetical protein
MSARLEDALAVCGTRTSRHVILAAAGVSRHQKRSMRAKMYEADLVHRSGLGAALC